MSQTVEGPVLARHRGGLDGAVRLAGEQHAPGDDQQFAGQRHDGFLVPDLDLLPAVEAAQRTVIAAGQAERHFDEDGPQERIAVFADAATPERLAGLDEGRIEAGIAGDLFGMGEAPRIAERGPDRPGGDHTDVRNGQQLPHVGDRLDSSGNFAFQHQDLGLKRGALAQRAGQNDAVAQRDTGQAGRRPHGARRRED